MKFASYEPDQRGGNVQGSRRNRRIPRPESRITVLPEWMTEFEFVQPEKVSVFNDDNWKESDVGHGVVDFLKRVLLRLRLWNARQAFQSKRLDECVYARVIWSVRIGVAEVQDLFHRRVRINGEQRDDTVQHLQLPGEEDMEPEFDFKARKFSLTQRSSPLCLRRKSSNFSRDLDDFEEIFEEKQHGRLCKIEDRIAV
ncbi:hypothetical protein VTN00DRAFT_1967 [Thermoascus crustaceus]|uniref:uncharacterized protein n=1 Tax=Thermoascus crustaceus TaxID=5088 RepID=UPI003742D72A